MSIQYDTIQTHTIVPELGTTSVRVVGLSAVDGFALSSSTASSTSTGSVALDPITGDVALAASGAHVIVDVDNDLVVNNVTNSTSPTTGAIVTPGGVGVGGDVYVAGSVSAGVDVHAGGYVSADGGIIVQSEIVNMVFQNNPYTVYLLLPIRFAHCGMYVVMTIPTCIRPSSAQCGFSAYGGVPVKYRPSELQVMSVWTTNSSNMTLGKLQVDTSGNLEIWSGEPSQYFPPGPAGGFYQTVLMYTPAV